MKSRAFTIERDEFNGVWYPYQGESDAGMIIMLGDSSDDHMARCGARWMHRQGLHAMAMSADKKDYGHHNYPLERFGRAISFMQQQGCCRIGIAGASTTGMLALIAASYYPQITLTIAMSPSDFVMEGFYRDNLDGMKERPGDDESTVSWQGRPLPYLPFAYRHPEYWQMLQKEAKQGGNAVASRQMFDESERRHPLQEEEKIKIENIQGKVICVGAQDDCLWDTCRYIGRMQERLQQKKHSCSFEAWVYQHGTHFVFPQSMLRMMLPVGSGLLVSLMFAEGKKHSKECLETRIDIDSRLQKAIREWKNH